MPTVHHELPPPPITISDPRGGVLTTDLLSTGPDEEKDPWQPSLRQVAVLLVVVLVVAIASVPVLLIQQGHRNSAADRAELAGISLEQADDDSSGVTSGDKIALQLKNNGPTALTVLSAHVDRTGYSDQQVRATVTRGAQATIELSPLGACPPAGALPASPSGVVVTVRTARGQRTTLRINVRDSFFSESYAQALRERCGAFPVEETFIATVLDVREEGGVVHGRLLLRNRSRVAHTISSLTVGEGFTLVLGTFPPITVPPGPNALDVEIAFSIKVSGCRLARTQMTAGTDPERSPSDYSFQSPTFGGINATSREDTYPEPFPLVYPDQLMTPLSTLISHTCKGTA